ncbi:MAG: glycosyltransferase, partial [Candidatus Eisenbacteria bacterium]|nr:glycosyltransferase [Candidatus Eisenbacteria bacterium]
AYALWQVYTVGIEQIMFGRTVSLTPQRLSSIYVNPNTLGLVMAFGFLFMFAKLLARRHWLNNLDRTLGSAILILGTLFFLSGLILSFSRSSWLFALVGALVLAWTIPLMRVISLTGLIGSALLLLLGPLPPWLIIGLRLGSGASDRNELWKAAARILEENPWTGLGPGHGVFEAYRPAFMDTMVERTLDYVAAGGAHNVFLNNAASLGWIGLILTVMGFWLFLKRVPRSLRAYRQGDWVAGAAAATVVGLFVRGFFESGTTIGHGQLNDTLVFLFCALVLMKVEDTSHESEIVVSPAGIRSLRTGGHRFWVALIRALKTRNHRVVEAVPNPPLGKSAIAALYWNLLWLGNLKRGVLLVDSSSHGRLGLALRVARLRNNLRIITVVHHMREEFALKNAWYERFARWNESWTLKMSDVIVVHSDTEKNLVLERGVPSHKVRHITLGTDRPSQPITIEARPEGNLRLLWVGGDFERKDLGSLLTALSLTKTAHKLTVVGSPEERTVLDLAKAQVASLGLEERVTFVGTLSSEDLAQCWFTHDVFVSPSKQEGHGMAVDEALSYGMPTVLTDLEVFRQRLDTNAVVFVPVGNPEHLASTLEELRPQNRRQALQKAALDLASRFPSWDDTYTNYVALIESHWRDTLPSARELRAWRTPAAEPMKSREAR